MNNLGRGQIADGDGLTGGRAWVKPGRDFIKDNGVWKLRHYHVVEVSG